MGMNTAIKNDQILDNAYGILGIEFMAAAQASISGNSTPGRGVQTGRADGPQARRAPGRGPAALSRPTTG